MRSRNPSFVSDILNVCDTCPKQWVVNNDGQKYMFLSDIKTTDFVRNKKYTFVVSIGATEQHGPFIPLGTDTYIHDAIVKKAEKYLPQVVFLPTLPVSCSEEHKGFPGSVWLQKTTMYAMLRDIGDSLREYAKNIIVISWHGGNEGLLSRFVKAEKKQYKKIRLIHLGMEDLLTDKKTIALLHGPIDEHAGNTEISMMLAIDKTLVVHPDVKKHPKHAFNHDWIHNAVIENSPDGVVDKHPDWVISKRLGEACLDMHAKLLIREINKIIHGRK